MAHFTIEIPLRGVSKGSTRAYRGVIIDSNRKKIKVEEGMIRTEFARKYPTSKPAEGPCFVIIQCGFSRPKNQFTATGKPSKKFKQLFTSTPDADKCARTVLDALTGSLFRDDRQVCFVACMQTWAESDFIHMNAFTDVEESDEILKLINSMVRESEEMK